MVTMLFLRQFAILFPHIAYPGTPYWGYSKYSLPTEEGPQSVSECLVQLVKQMNLAEQARVLFLLNILSL